MPETENLIKQALGDGWQEGHDLTCDFAMTGKECEHHPNPYRMAN